MALFGDPLGDLLDPVRKKPKFAPLTPEELNSQTSTLLDKSIGLLQYVGETLDKPGRAARGLLAGRPEELLNLVPFSDAMGLTDPNTSTSGRDLLEQAGILDQNEAGLDAGDVAGFATEILTDPTTYMTFGASALSKGGKALKGAGVLSKTGARARLGSTVGEIVGKLDDVGRATAMEALQTTARKAGGTVDDLLAQPVGGLMKLSVPFTGAETVIGTGSMAKKFAGAAGTVGDAMRYGKIPGTDYSPGQHLAALFSPGDLGVMAPEVSPFANELSSGYADIVRKSRAETAKDITDRAFSGLLDDAGSDAIRKTVEVGGHLPYDTAAGKTASNINERFVLRNEKNLAEAASYGIDVTPHGDLAGVLYGPRQAVDELPNKNFSARRVYDKHFHGGTETVNKIYADPDVINAPSIKEAADVIQAKYGGQYWGEDSRNAFEFLANSVKSKTEAQQGKLFGYDINADIQSRHIALRGEIKRADTMLDALSKFAKPITELKTAEPVMKISEIIPQIRLQEQTDTGGALVKLLEKMGVSADEQSLAAVKNLVVPERLAKSLIGMNSSFNAPEAAGKLLSMIDTWTNTFKVGVLSWPSRVVRDLMSGQAMNVLTGNFTTEAANDAVKLIKGGTVENSLKIPIVKQMLAERGLPATAENGTAILRELAYTDQMFSASQGIGGTGSMSGTASKAVQGRSKELVSEFPGLVPITPKSIATAGTSWWNPLDIRALTQSPTGFKPVAIIEEASRFTDGANRLVPYLKNLYEGMAPKEAANLVNAIQVNYKPEAFTAFERKVLKRVMPFYSFASRMVPETIKQLMERPGGGIAQALRASNAPRSKEAFIPDYVSEGTAIPVGKDGRYLTGFGMMHESLGDVAALRPSATGTVTRTAQKLGAMLNPALKLPIELMTGVNMYTGRPQRELYQFPTDEPIVNMLLGNTPLSRSVNTVRKLTDDRKSIPDKALALTTGIGVTDLSGGIQRAKELTAKRLLEEKLLESPRIKQHSELYVPEELYPMLTEKEKMAMRAYYTMQKNAQKAAKEKKKQRDLAAQFNR